MFEKIQVISVFVLTGFNYSMSRKHKATRLKSFIMAAFYSVLSWQGVFFLSWLCNDFIGFGTQNAVRGFALLPLFTLFQAKMFNENFRELSDRFAVGPVLSYGVGHIACIFTDCCHGFEYNEGTVMYKIANSLTGTNMLPQQLIESVFAIITAVLVFIIFRKKKQDVGGRLFSIMLIAYGVQRFIFEFFRDNDKIFIIKEMSGAMCHGSDKVACWGISELALWAASLIVIGVTIIIILNIQDNKKVKVNQTVSSVEKS